MDACSEAHAAAIWAREEFGHANLGDERRTKRLTQMAASAALFPSGKLSDVFQSAADAQGAYKFVENDSVKAEAISEAAGLASAKRCANESLVFVAVDGSSLTLTDHGVCKNFGTIGAYSQGARGLKVVAALAVDIDGVPCGLTSMQWWARQKMHRARGETRKLEDKELGHWFDACTETIERFTSQAPHCRMWFQLDREADAWQLLLPLASTRQFFTVRSSVNRNVLSETGARRKVLDELARPSAYMGRFSLEVPEGPRRTARTAHMTYYAAPVILLLRDKVTRRVQALMLNAVRALETSGVPNGETPIEWVLYTNHPITTAEDALLVIHGYSQRWRIEDFFRSWKTGACNVESTQLHDINHVKIWANMLASVATRIERLKHLARAKPDLPATEEFSADELQALKLLKSKRKKKNEHIPDTTPTIAQAVLWTAQLGGYTGKSSGGPPGSVTIRRGLERLEPAAEAIRILKENGHLR
jgi:hypothetical protein